MLLKNLYINVYIRVVFIVLSGVGLGMVVQHIDEGYYYTLTGIISLIAFQAWMLVNKVNKTNMDLEKFFSSVHDRDSTIRFTESNTNSSFRRLYDRMNYLNATIQNIKIENERTSHFLQCIVDHVDIGLLAFDEQGTIRIYNRAIKRFIEVQQPTQLSLLNAMDEALFAVVNSIKPGQEILYNMKRENLQQRILVKAAELKFEDNKIKVVSFQDITSELDKKEMDSWQKLIRVLTHEIMNSISPITSLTAVISGYFKDKDKENPLPPDKIDHQIIDKTLSGLNTIEETGKGLLDFVDKYRSLTTLPKPQLSKFTVDSLFRKCTLLMGSTISGNTEISSTIYPEDIAMVADYPQIEQVLINLIKNSKEALGNKLNGIIRMKALYSDGSIIIQVEDNGVGIPHAIIEDVFVPFFTTKESGSGIGLSLSRQIMQNHNGTISVNSVPGKGTTFTLKFQK